MENYELSLKEIKDLNQSIPIRGCGLLEEGHHEGTLRLQVLRPGPVALSLFMLPADPGVGLSATSPALCLPV